MRYLRIGIAVVTLLASGLLSQAAAQVSMTTADVERLQQTVFDIGGDIARLRPRDARLADTLQGAGTVVRARLDSPLGLR